MSYFSNKSSAIYKQLTSLITLFAIVLMSACSTVDPYSGEKKTGNATKGAAIGAIAGAVLGAATAGGDKNKSILTGAAAGAAAGGGIGYYMDVQEAKLRQQLEGTGVGVRREGDNIYLVMPGNITFDTAKYTIRGDFYEVLDSVVLVLKEFKKTVIEVSGHTDSVGNSDYNQTLSEQRAASVKNYLVSQGISSGRVQSIGYGFRYPVAPNATSAGRAQNRRVELKLEAFE